LFTTKKNNMKYNEHLKKELTENNYSNWLYYECSDFHSEVSYLISLLIDSKHKEKIVDILKQINKERIN